jgi:hypothetical protein
VASLLFKVVFSEAFSFIERLVSVFFSTDSFSGFSALLGLLFFDDLESLLLVDDECELVELSEEDLKT